MLVLVAANTAKPQAKELATQVGAYLFARNVTVCGLPEQAQELDFLPYSKGMAVDFIVSLGGDGSILAIIHELPELTSPIMGINLGSLGFLADIPVNSTFEALDTALKGAYTVQERMMLSGRTKEGKACVAVNEMVVHRAQNHCLVDFSVKVDGKQLNTFSADGVIVATPSGSTAYSLSAGGPILTPELDAIVITPICPHTISNRPIVLKVYEQVEIEYLSPFEPVEVTSDGKCRFTLKTHETFTILPATRTFRLMALESIDFFATLRKKLAWTGTLKS